MATRRASIWCAVRSPWLAEQGLVRTEELEAGVLVAAITERGLDVAGGRAVVPGVRRAPPGTCMA